MVEHCRDARYVWNMAVEQANLYRRHLGPTPNHLQRCRQLTEARHEFDWLAAGSQTVQQQALRDFDQGMTNWWAGTHRRPSWRKAGLNEGFRQVALKPDHVQRLNRRWAQVLVPKVGWVRFRWTRAVPADVKSYRVTMDRARPLAHRRGEARTDRRSRRREHRRYRPGRRQHLDAVDRRDDAVPGADRRTPGGAASVPGHARLEAAAGRAAGGREAQGERRRPAQGLGREVLHRHRDAFRPRAHRGPAHRQHGPLGEGDDREPRHERATEGRLEPFDPRPRGACSPGGSATRSATGSSWSLPRLHLSAVLDMRGGGPEQPRAKPSSCARPAGLSSTRT